MLPGLLWFLRHVYVRYQSAFFGGSATGQRMMLVYCFITYVRKKKKQDLVIFIRQKAAFDGLEMMELFIVTAFVLRSNGFGADLEGCF